MRNARTPLTPPQQRLARQYMPMARKLARPAKDRWPSLRDEFDSVAYLALVEAAQSFDPERGVKFATFARHRILGALSDASRKWAADRARRRLQLDLDPALLVRRVSWRGVWVVGLFHTPPADEAIERGEEVQAWLRRLPPRYAEAIRALYIHGLTQVQAAQQLGCSQARLSDMRRDALAMLHEAREAGISAAA